MITSGTAILTSSVLEIQRSRSRSMANLSGGVLTRVQPANLISAESLRAALASLDAELRCVERNDAVAATADAALGEVSALLRRAETLVVANANEGATSDAERRANQTELDAIVESIDRIGQTTEFAGTRLLDGGISLAAGGETLELPAISAGRLGRTFIDGSTYSLASLVGGSFTGAQTVLANAISDVATARGQVGSFQTNMLQSMRNSFADAMASVSVSLSSVFDTDFATEAADLARADLLEHASLSALELMLHSSSSILSLFDAA